LFGTPLNTTLNFFYWTLSRTIFGQCDPISRECSFWNISKSFLRKSTILMFKLSVRPHTRGSRCARPELIRV